jgi:hypothetical protein
MSRIGGAVIFLTIVCIPSFSSPVSMTASLDFSWVVEPDFWAATAANVAGIGLFMSRVYWPAAVPAFALTTEILGIPALTIGVLDLCEGRVDATTVGAFCYAGWALGAVLVDHVFRVNYRDPVNLAVLIPYVVAYYVAIGVLSASQLSHGVIPWIIAGGTCILAVGASFYARAKGAD